MSGIGDNKGNINEHNHHNHLGEPASGGNPESKTEDENLESESKADHSEKLKILSDLEGKFIQLSIDPRTSAQARRLAKEYLKITVCDAKEHRLEKDQNNALQASVIFVASQISASKKIPLLAQLLTTTSTSPVDFARNLHHFVSHFDINFGKSFIEEVKIFESSLLLIIVIFKRYKELFERYFKNELKELKETEIFSFGWILFLSTRLELFGPFTTDLHQLLLLLICVVRKMADSVPNKLISSVEASESSKSDSSDVDLVLKELCMEKDKWEELYRGAKNLFKTNFHVYLRLLVKNRIVQTIPTGVGEMEHQWNLLSKLKKSDEFENAFSKRNIAENLQRLNGHYELIMANACRTNNILKKGFWLDERIFLYEKKTSTPSKLMSFGNNLLPSESSNSKSLYKYEPSGSLFSPPKLTKPNTYGTPISKMMEAVSWLSRCTKNQSHEYFEGTEIIKPWKTLINLLNELDSNEKVSKSRKPSASFSEESSDFKESKVSGKEEIESGFVQGLVEKSVLQLAPKIAFPNASNEYQKICLDFYYFLLHSMICSEIERLKGNISPLRTKWLQVESFHKALLGLSMEVVIFAYQIPTLSFPKILEIMQITCFDFLKVIEPGVRISVSAPRSVKTHLKEIENRMLEELAWKSSEPLVSILRKPKFMEYLKTNLKKKGLKNNALFESKSNNDNDLDTSEPDSKIEDVSFEEKSDAKISSNLSSGISFKGLRFSAEMCYRKLLKMISDKLDYLCAKRQLNIGYKLMEQVWIVINYVLFEKFELVVNRNVDTIILCAIYGVVNKLAGQNLLFRKIIAVYMSLWEKNNDIVIRRIPLMNLNSDEKFNQLLPFTSSVECGHIIYFYNEIFIPNVKRFLVHVVKQEVNKIRTETNVTTGTRPNESHYLPPHPQWRGTASSNPVGPRRVVAKGIFLSPLKERRFGSSTSTQANSLRNPMQMMTPTTRALYAFGESPSRNIHDINRRINNNKGRKLDMESSKKQPPRKKPKPR